MADYSSAKQAYTSSSVMTAPPHRLVVMLYEGAIRFLRQSAMAMRNGTTDAALHRMQRAQAIIDELNLSLDMEQGGEVSHVGSSRVDLQACKLEYSIVSPK